MFTIFHGQLLIALEVLVTTYLLRSIVFLS